MLLNRKKVNRKEKNRNKKKSGRESGSRGEKNGVPDTAHDCPILRIGVACEKPAPEIWKTLQRGVFQLSYAAFPHTTKPPIISRFLFWKMPQGTWRSDSYSGRQMTGKFRKVASHYAPEPALGLFLNCQRALPLEPRHVNGVSNPAKCPQDIPSEDLLID